MEVIFIKKIVESSSSSDSSSDNSDTDVVILSMIKRMSHKKIQNYVQSVVRNYSLDDFRCHFRLTRANVERFIIDIQVEETYINCTGRPKIPVLDAVLLSLWCLANQESFRAVGDRFGVSRGHAHTIFIKMCKIISSSVKKFIIWPKNIAALQNVEKYNSLRGARSFPNVFGCVDGTHVQIPGPIADNSYYNRKGYHSLLLQAICNSTMEFIDVFCGWPGSAHDSRMWKESYIYQNLLENKQNWLPNNTYLLGDSAYPLDEFIIVPFRDNGHLTERQKLFNTRLSSTRVIIEQAFGRLKGIFRKLKYLNVTNLSHAKYVIFSACILHNAIIQYKEDINEGDMEIIPNEDAGENEQFDDRPELRAIDLRNRIMQNMNV